MGLGLFSFAIEFYRRLSTPRNVCFSRPVQFNSHMKFRGEGTFTLGARTRNRGTVILESVLKTSKITIGKNVFLNRNCMIVSRKEITIGDDCMFGPNVFVYDHDHYFTKTKVFPYKYREKEIQIGKNVWIGANVVILRGSVIGDGSVIGAGSVVNGVVPARSIVRPAHTNVEPIAEKH